jgi:hypothetical protein
MSGQLSSAPTGALPLHPEELVSLEPLARGKAYNLADLDSWQRACAEEARRMVLAGAYPVATNGGSR